jgi:hypothetical protein
MQPFLALITPVGDTPAQPPLGIWGPTDPRPSNPIANVPGAPGYQPPGGQQPPLGFWGPPQMPPGFWGGGMGPGVKPQPPAGAHPEHPIYIPIEPPPDAPHPEHPIYIPVVPGQPLPPLPPELLAKVKAAIEFWTGNLPTNPDEVPTPV